MKTLDSSVNKRRREAAADDPEAGWTFVETLVSIGIVLLLSTSVGFFAFKYLEKAKTTTARSQISTLALALDAYYMDCGAYPTAEQGLSALWEAPKSEPVPAAWNGPYLSRKLPLDPWGGAYEYIIPGEGGLPFGIRSLGADRREGGEKNDKDICSWEE